MTTRRRTTPPVPMSPIHRRSWRSLWRRCSCGLKEPCIDRRTASVLYLPTEQPPPPAPPQTPRHPDGLDVQSGVRASAPFDPNLATTPNDGYAAVFPLDPAARSPSLARMRRSASSRIPVPVPQPGRAGSLTPAQALRADHAQHGPDLRAAPGRADHAQRRQDPPTLRAAAPGRAYGSGPHQAPPHHPALARNHPDPARNRPYDGRRMSDSTS